MPDAPPLVNPKIVAVGATLHVTPIDQALADIPIDLCRIESHADTFVPGLNIPDTVTVTYDETGAILTGVAPGGGMARWKGTSPGGGTVVYSDLFMVTVPWPVTAIGDKTP